MSYVLFLMSMSSEIFTENRNQQVYRSTTNHKSCKANNVRRVIGVSNGDRDFYAVNILKIKNKNEFNTKWTNNRQYGKPIISISINLFKGLVVYLSIILCLDGLNVAYVTRNGCGIILVRNIIL